MATIKDLARRAGVSTAIVFCLLNRKYLVSAKSTRRMKRAIQPLHYPPTGKARTLTLSRSSVFGFLARYIDRVRSVARASAWAGILALGWGVATETSVAGTLSHPDVDRYNLRAGTQTFNGQYQFTTNTLLVETADVIRRMGSDVIKLYLGRDWQKQYHVPLPAHVTNLTALVRDEPSCRRIFDQDFRHYFVWAYGFTVGGDAYWLNGMTVEQRALEHAEIYALTRYLLTQYDGTGKRFYLGHWEGDWYLLPNYQTKVNPSATAIQGMRDWLNVRQQAVDEAKRDTPHGDVDVFAYAEVNRVRDAMLNGPASNQRLVNTVLPAVTNLDYASWSSYDGQDLSASELYATLNYIESKLSTNKATLIPGRRVFIGEYGWGSLDSTTQESRTRTYLRTLRQWGPPFMLFWQVYNNEPGRAFWLIDSAGRRTPCYNLHQRYFNAARLALGEYLQRQGRLPTDAEFGALMRPVLTRPLTALLSLAVTNVGPTDLRPDTATVSCELRQGVYGEPGATVLLAWGPVDAGTNLNQWQEVSVLGVNSAFGVARFQHTLSSLQPGRDYFFRAMATNGNATAWAESTASFHTPTALPGLSHVGMSSEGPAFWVNPGESIIAGTLEVQSTDALSPEAVWATRYHTNIGAFPWVDIEARQWPKRFYRAVCRP